MRGCAGCSPTSRWTARCTTRASAASARVMDLRKPTCATRTGSTIRTPLARSRSPSGRRCAWARAIRHVEARAPVGASVAHQDQRPILFQAGRRRSEADEAGFRHLAVRHSMPRGRTEPEGSQANVLQVAGFDHERARPCHVDDGEGTIVRGGCAHVIRAVGIRPGPRWRQAGGRHVPSGGRGVNVASPSCGSAITGCGFCAITGQAARPSSLR